MRLLQVLATALSFTWTSAHAEEHVFQLPRAASQKSVLESYDKRPIDFGMSAAQRDGLYRLSGGRVDLRDYWRVRFPEGSKTDPTRLRGWRGAVPAVVPPTFGMPQSHATGSRFMEAGMDPALANQWWVRDLNAPGAWAYATGRGVTIADCDAGYYVAEGDLEGNLVIDQRRDFSDQQHPLEVADGSMVFHGTAVAAIMAGVKDGVGTQGLAYDAKLIPLQNFNYDRRLDGADKEEATARCILYALRIPGVDVIVVENQTPTGSSETYAGTREAVKAALQAGIAVVAAAGNAAVELRTEQTSDTGSILVGALRQGGKMANFSNFGPRVTVAAFGENLVTLYGPGGRMDAFGGTTGAAAQVGAAVALMREANPDLTPAQLRQILVKTRKTTADNQKVGGQLDVLAAVQLARDMRPDFAARDEQRAFRAAAAALLDGARF